MSEFIREILDTLTRNKSRSFLTGFGVFWGVFMLIALIGYGAGYQIWMNVGLVAIAATLLLYAKESIELFISKKVSILHWILYLCAVEILPFTLLWQGVVRLA